MMRKKLILIVALLPLMLAACQSTNHDRSLGPNGVFEYTASPVVAITTPIIMKYRPFSNTKSTIERTATTVLDHDKKKTTNTESESTVSLTKLGDNLLWQSSAKIQDQGVSFTALMKETGEVVEMEIAGEGIATTVKLKRELEDYKKAFKAYAALYPSGGLKTGDILFEDRGEIRMPSSATSIFLKGEVKGLVNFRQRRSILVDLDGSYAIVASLGKLNMQGWMLLDVETGAATQTSTHLNLAVSKNGNVKSFEAYSFEELYLQP